MQRLKKITITPAASADTGISLSQTPGAGGFLTVTGSLMSAGNVTLSPARRVRITAAADETARTFTITGVDRLGNPQSETVTGPNTTTVDSLNDYGSGPITIAVDAGTAGAVKVGTSGVMSSAWQPLDRLDSNGVGLGMEFSGTANAGVEYAMDDPFSAGVGVNGSIPYLVPYAHAVLAAQSANIAGSILFPVTAVRLKINSFSSGASVSLTIAPGTAGDP